MLQGLRGFDKTLRLITASAPRYVKLGMASCCEDKACAIEALQAKQASTLKVVLWINAVMFFVVLAMGIYADSSALLADALDNLGDALTYALSLYAVRRGLQTKSRVALFKGLLILGAGVAVMARVLYSALHPEMPVFEAMGATSLIALAANGTCLALLWRHRAEDVNMSSVWECSRNDIASNAAVLVAAFGVWLPRGTAVTLVYYDASQDQ